MGLVSAVRRAVYPTVADGERIELNVDASGRLIVASQGSVLSGAADDSSAPVKVAGVYRTTLPTFVDGQRAELQIGTNGALLVEGFTSGGDSMSNGSLLFTRHGDLTARLLGSFGYVYNGATADRLRTPTVFKPFASTAITAGTGFTVWTPGAGKKFRLMGWMISSSVAGQIIFGDNLVGTVIARSEALVAAGVSNASDGLGNGILSAVANNVLKIDGPTGNVAGMVWGTEE